MGSVSSEEEELDQLSERYEFDSYSLSADVSESESSSSFSCCPHYDHHHAASTSFTSSPFTGPQFPDGFLNSSPPTVPIMLPVVGGRHVPIPAKNAEKPESDLSEVEMMKERFSKLLLGEDMSGGGNGVCTALAISNAITNLSASVFGDLWKLEPLSQPKKSLWHREMEWLLCVSDFIVELVPSMQDFPGGGTFEVMVPRPRSDLHVNLPALKKLDTMLLSILDGFCNSEFYYVDHKVIVAGDETRSCSLSSSSSRPSTSQEEKWWLPFPKVPRNGLSEDTRKRLQQYRECTNQILKAAMAINNNVLSEMEIPNTYLESLPKNGKDCLGENLYRHITANRFSPDRVLDYLDLSSEYSSSEIANRIEAAAHIWRKKYLKSQKVPSRADEKRSTWGGKVKGLVGEVQRCKLLARRAETLLHNLRLRFPALPQTDLDMNKIQYNKDVGHAIIESYSRVTESIAFNILARIDDLLYVDDATKRATAESMSLFDQERLARQKPMSPSPFSFQRSPSASQFNSSYKKPRIPGGKTHHSAKSKLKDTPIQTLQKLTFQ